MVHGVLQAASMAHPGEPVNAELIHRVLGLPMPSEVNAIFQILLEKDLQFCSTGKLNFPLDKN